VNALVCHAAYVCVVVALLVVVLESVGVDVVVVAVLEVLGRLLY